MAGTTQRAELSSFTPGMRLPMARANAASHMPYFTSGIQHLVPREAPGLGTFGVTELGHLMVDPAILARLYVDEAGTLVLHEYLHIYFNHAERFREMVRKGLLESSDHALWNQAADCEINDNLQEAGCIFPRDEVMGGPPTTPDALDLPRHRPAEEYAVTLKKRQQDGDDGNPRPPEAGDDQDGAWPACGSGAGNPVAGEPEPDDADGRDPTEMEMQRQSDSEQARDHQRAQGNVPSGIQQMVDSLLKPPKVRWDAELTTQVGQAVQHKAGSADYTFTKRSHHQSAMEWYFGEEAPVLPGMWAPLAKVALVIDTSGSMAQALKTVVEEAQGILKTMGGMRLTVIACDAKVHAVAEVKNVSELSQHMLGGGGTDFRPAFRAIEEMPKRDRPDVVVFATDGWGDYPSEAPPWKHIWLNIDGDISVDWGTEIAISAEEL